MSISYDSGVLDPLAQQELQVHLGSSHKVTKPSSREGQEEKTVLPIREALQKWLINWPGPYPIVSFQPDQVRENNYRFDFDLVRLFWE
jgi:hypothetical protein